ncbi:type I phosphodiesterase/nucleotide pyrophosphatase/phosphate transferase [Neoconidiobolus thromboides FSU 785]|nr:type I phosphodiesterase/nucleotide pyrophosphatase/phosphate transferase [Neoconidiobolus thromboides FSU 785]
MVQMWPGSDIKYEDSSPDYLELYNKLILPNRKINNILDKLDNPIELRPRLILSYFPEVDTVGHLLGSNSFVLDKTIKKVDKAIGSLFNGLKKKNMLDEVNIIIVSDHGMSKIERKNVIYLDDVIDLNTVKSIHMYPYAGLSLFNETTIDVIYEQLKKEEERLSDLVKVFKRKQLFPSDNSRISELILIPKRVNTFLFY